MTDLLLHLSRVQGQLGLLRAEVAELRERLSGASWPAPHGPQEPDVGHLRAYA